MRDISVFITSGVRGEVLRAVVLGELSVSIV